MFLCCATLPFIIGGRNVAPSHRCSVPPRFSGFVLPAVQEVATTVALILHLLRVWAFFRVFFSVFIFLRFLFFSFSVFGGQELVDGGLRILFRTFGRLL